MEKLLRGRLAMRLMPIAVMRQRVNATTASIPGPTEPRYLAGARVLEVVPLVPLVANEPLAVAAFLYAGALVRRRRGPGRVPRPRGVRDRDARGARGARHRPDAGTRGDIR